jgi:hypothetical protein
MYWQLRYARNTLIASVPGYQKLRQLKRSLIPYDSTLDPWTFEQGVQTIEMLREAGARLEGAVVLELGSGWKPVIPLLFRLAGARHVMLIDSEQLLDGRLLADTARQVSCEIERVSNRLQVSPQIAQSLLDVRESASLESVANQLGLTYLAPVDARRLPFNRGDIDIVSSRAVLEHVPRSVLIEIFREFARLLNPGTGYMCHIVDNSDHWAHGDRRLSMLNFLRYPESTWKWLAKNPLDFMNRMRHSEYVRLLDDANFDVVLDLSQPDEKALNELNDLPISPEFQKFARRDLAILTSRLVAVRGHGETT